MKKSLGPIEVLTNLSEKKREFARFLMKEEARMRTEHWKGQVKNPTFIKYISIERIEELRTRLFRAKKEMGEFANGVMEMGFKVDFIYNSNRMEGSKLPREKVARDVQGESGKKSYEVSNTLKALSYVDYDFKFRPGNIVKLHKILLEHEPRILGLRKEAVVVAESYVHDWQTIRPELEDLCSWYEKERKTMYPPELAFDFYYRFERIHPFKDGNGRVGRLIMNRILKDHKYHPIIIWNKRRQAHLTAFSKRMEGRSEDYYKFMEEQFIKTHEIYLEKIEKAINYEVILNHFLSPSELSED